MLVLSRKKGEQLVVGIGDHTILIRIVDVRGEKVRIGVTAPREVVVHRQEIWNRLTERRGSAQALPAVT
ncbi:MAG: carbon storage regulator [Planctomycetes bacterium]|nr:carbon storage regulator [Planctomycetota bacterium]